MSVSITKSDGTVENFDKNKLIASLRRAGAEESAAGIIADTIARSLPDGATTHEIYGHAFEQLRVHRREAAARYSLKRAILDFGPSGFPFESFLAELFRTEGYEASTDRHIKGRCVEHEVDVVLSKPGESMYIEAKFHNTAGFKTDLQVALYVKARMDDIIAGLHDTKGTKHRGLIATNTKFTSLAVQFAECAGLELLAWEYPVEHNLHTRIESSGLYPITALTTLSRSQKTSLLAERIVLCRDLSRQGDALRRAGVPANELSDVLTEAGNLSVRARHSVTN